jgi:hypothetical protein
MPILNDIDLEPIADANSGWKPSNRTIVRPIMFRALPNNSALTLFV